MYKGNGNRLWALVYWTSIPKVDYELPESPTGPLQGGLERPALNSPTAAAAVNPQ